MNAGLQDDTFEVNQAACSSLDFFNEYLYQNIKRPKKKQPALAQNIGNFYQQCSVAVYSMFMQTLTFAIVFEDHKNLWVYQKCFHSTIVLADP